MTNTYPSVFNKNHAYIKNNIVMVLRTNVCIPSTNDEERRITSL